MKSKTYLILACLFLTACSSDGLVVKWYVSDLSQTKPIMIIPDTVVPNPELYLDLDDLPIQKRIIDSLSQSFVSGLDLTWDVVTSDSVSISLTHATTIQFQNSNVIVSRLLIADLKQEYIQPRDVFICSNFGLIMEKYHGSNYRYVCFIEQIVSKKRTLVDVRSIIRQIFADTDLFPVNTRS